MSEASLKYTPPDLRGFVQAHFFAGIGGWALAARIADWPDDRELWTGSCPCQPFSAAGKGAGFSDERHLWPEFKRLIAERRPSIVAGEQVASKDADPWIDLVHADLEALGYAFGAVPFPAASIGAPHIRDRLYWVASGVGQADTGSTGLPQRERVGGVPGGTLGADAREALERGGVRAAGGLGNAELHGLASPERGSLVGGEVSRDGSRLLESEGPDSPALGLADDNRIGFGTAPGFGLRDDQHHVESRGLLLEGQPAAGPTNGFWRDADWLHCRDGKWRPVEPGTFPLAHGISNRVGRLRAYGNAIVPQEAAEVLAAVLACRP